MKANRVGRIAGGLVCVAALLIPCAPGGSADAAPPTTGPEAQRDLAQYYGFGPMEILKLEWGIGRPVVADINRDGLNDLILTNNRKSRIELLLQKKAGPTTGPDVPAAPAAADRDDVNDLFSNQRSWRFKRVSYPLDVAASNLVVADLNHDGRPDLAYYAGTRGLYLVLQEPAEQNEARAGSGADRPPADAAPAAPTAPQWRPPVKIEITDGLTAAGSLAAGDLNGDGRADLALLAAGGTLVVLQKDDGAMARPVKHPTGGGRLRQVDIADLNGDRRADLLLLSGDRDYPVCVRYQTSGGQLGPEVRYQLPSPTALVPCRLDKSTRRCLLSISRQSGRVRLSALAPDSGPAAFPVYTYPLPVREGAEKRDFVAADVDGDGRLDMVVSDPAQAEFLLFRARAGTHLGTPTRFPGLMEMGKLCAGDLGGGRHAVVALSAKEKIIGVSRFVKGRLTFPQSVRLAGEPLAMDLCDVSGDGRLDLVYVAKDKQAGKFFLRTVLDVGRAEAKAGGQIELTTLKDKPQDVRVGDIDHDGRPDVMILRPYEPMLLVRQTADGKFAQELRRDVQSGLVANVFPNTLTLTPLGAKGSPAVLLARKNFARALVFDDAKGWQVVDQYEAADPRSNLAAATACKLAPEAKSLAIVTYDSARGKLGLLTPQPDGTYRTTSEVEVGSLTARKILSGNFGGRTPISLLLCAAQKLVLVPTAARKDVLREVASFEPDIKNGRFGEVAVGDVNHDGQPDILLAEQARHHVEILTFDAESRLVAATKFKVFEQPREVARSSFRRDDDERGEPRAILCGDVTGDGKVDLILLVHDRIVIYPQD